MKRVKRWAVVAMAAMMLTGCGKKETVTSQGEEMREEQENTGQDTAQSGTGELRNAEGTEITSYEELEAYQAGRMEKIIAAFTDSGLTYELTENQKFACNKELEYTVLENSYRMACVGYSMYDSSIGAVDTVMSVRYEFHPEKGLSAEDGSMKLLYSFIQAADNEELKEKFKSGEELAAGLMEVVGTGTASTVYDAGNVRLAIEVERSSKYIVKYAELDRVFCKIKQPEVTCKEFNSYDDYKTYLGDGGTGREEGALSTRIIKYITDRDDQVINYFEHPDAVSTGSDFETLLVDSSGIHTYMSDWMTVNAFTYRNRDNKENNFEIKISFDIQFDEIHKDMAKEYLHMTLECLQNEKALPENVDMEDLEKEILSHAQIYMSHYSTYGLVVKDWFGIEIWKYSKYPYLEESHVILVPVKVEGLLNE